MKLHFCRLAGKKNIRGVSENPKTKKKETKILTQRGSHHQINQQKELVGSAEKALAWWSSAAPSNYKAQRDVSWQVDQHFSEQGSGQRNMPRCTPCYRRGGMLLRYLERAE